MGKQDKEKARGLRTLLFSLLGAECVVPGCKEHEYKKLTFDLKKPKGDKHHKGSTDQRMAFYWKEFARGNVQVLCHKHNSEKGDMSNEAFLAQYMTDGERWGV